MNMINVECSRCHFPNTYNTSCRCLLFFPKRFGRDMRLRILYISTGDNYLVGRGLDFNVVNSIAKQRWSLSNQYFLFSLERKARSFSIVPANLYKLFFLTPPPITFLFLYLIGHCFLLKTIMQFQLIYSLVENNPILETIPFCMSCVWKHSRQDTKHLKMHMNAISKAKKKHFAIFQ